MADNEPSRPNVLIFCVDEMRADHMACDGNPVIRTPHLDRLAARGTVFRRAYCNNPICMPARATMFTGLLPRDHGLRVNGQSLRRDLPTLAGVLAGNGYRTHAAGKLHLTPWARMVEPPQPERYPESMQYWTDGVIEAFPVPYYGFQSVDFVGGHTSWVYGEYMGWLRDNGGDRESLRASLGPCSAPQCSKMALPRELHYNRYIADSTIRLIQACAGANRPFFAWCSFPDPHMPVAPPAPYCDMYDPRDVPLPVRREGEVGQWPEYLQRIAARELKYQGRSVLTDVTDDQWRELIALTYGMVSHVDDEMGRVLDALDRHGLTENTLIAFVSDHGDMMGDHGLIWKGPYTFQGCSRIPFVVAAPGTPGGATQQALVSQIDLMPSVLDFCGVPLPGSDWQRATQFAWGQVHDLGLYPGRSWVPLLSDPDAQTHDRVVIENDNPPTGLRIRSLVTRTHRLAVYPGTQDGELFDLVNDPNELSNLWDEARARDLKQGLIQDLLDAYCAQTPFYPVPQGNA